MVSMKTILTSVTDVIQGLTIGNMRCFHCLEPVTASLMPGSYKLDFCPAEYLCLYRRVTTDPSWDFRIGNWTLWPGEDTDACCSVTGRWYYGPALR